MIISNKSQGKETAFLFNMQAQKQLNQHTITNTQSATRFRMSEDRTPNPSGVKEAGLGKRRLSSANPRTKARRISKNRMSLNKEAFSSLGTKNKNSYQHMQPIIVHPYQENLLLQLQQSESRIQRPVEPVWAPADQTFFLNENRYSLVSDQNQNLLTKAQDHKVRSRSAALGSRFNKRKTQS